MGRDLTAADQAEWDRYARHCRILPERPAEMPVPQPVFRRRPAGFAVVRHRLDLHGHTAQLAHRAVLSFVRQAYASGLRQVEIITGLGGGDQGGVLRRELPFWLDDAALRPLVQAISHPDPRNPGAMVIRLRRVAISSLRR